MIWITLLKKNKLSIDVLPGSLLGAPNQNGKLELVYMMTFTTYGKASNMEGPTRLGMVVITKMRWIHTFWNFPSVEQTALSF